MGAGGKSGGRRKGRRTGESSGPVRDRGGSVRRQRQEAAWGGRTGVWQEIDRLWAPLVESIPQPIPAAWRRGSTERRAWDSNPQPVSRHHISSVAANHSLTLQTHVFWTVCPAVCPGVWQPQGGGTAQKTCWTGRIASIAAAVEGTPIGREAVCTRAGRRGTQGTQADSAPVPPPRPSRRLSAPFPSASTHKVEPGGHPPTV